MNSARKGCRSARNAIATRTVILPFSRRTGSVRVPLLLLQQPAFPLDAPPVAAQAAVLLHHAMARDYQAHVVGRACTRNRADAARCADGGRNITVGTRFAVRNRLQIAPHLPL